LRRAVIRLFVPLAEYHPIIQDKVEQAREAKCQEITQHHIPLGEILDEQQRSHLHKKDGSTGEVVASVVLQKRVPRTPADPVFPNKEIGNGEVGQHRTLKRKEGGDDTLPYIRSLEEIGGTEP